MMRHPRAPRLWDYPLMIACAVAAIIAAGWALDRISQMPPQ
ncbi:hypothetical protein AB7M49_007013 [Bradyrhizobium elkanii]